MQGYQFDTTVGMVYMTTIFCKDFGKELLPQPTLTQPLQAVLSLEGLTVLWDLASALPVPPEPGEVPYF